MVCDIGMARCHNLRHLRVLVNNLPMQNIEILRIIILVLILHNRHRHITLMIHSMPNHLSLPEHSSIHPIILMDPIFFTYQRDDYGDDFVLYRNSIWK